MLIHAVYCRPDYFGRVPVTPFAEFVQLAAHLRRGPHRDGGPLGAVGGGLYAHVLAMLKDEYDMAGGYHIEKGRPPKPTGAYWLEFRHDSAEHGRVDFDVARG